MTAELSVPVSSAQTVTRSTMNVTAAHNAAGDLLGFSSATERLEIINLRSTQYPVQYRIGSGDWQDIKEGKTAVISIDLSTQTVRLRRSLYAGPVMVVDLVMYSKPSGLVAGDSETDPSSVSGDVTHAQASTNSLTGTHGEVRILSDGPAVGQRVRWWKPGAAAGFWGYDISPTDQYTG